MPDGSWKAAEAAPHAEGGRHCLDHLAGRLALKEYPYEFTGGTGKYKGAKGGGTYKYDELTDTLFGGRYHSKWELP